MFASISWMRWAGWLPFLVLWIVSASQVQAAATIDTKAREAILIDYTTGTVLMERNPDHLSPPASMTKIMTAYLAFERLKDGRLKMDDKIPISAKSWRKGGSKMFVELDSQIPVIDILRGIVVQSGNDAAIALAEALGGSEEGFAEMMTNKAREIGMDSSTFRNATGWPDPDHRVTVRDLATLALRTIRDFPDYYPLYAEKTFTYNKIRQGNRNPLLYKGMGADGLKTGHTNEAGYGLTSSVKRGDRRLILVVNGLKSVRQRSSESQRLLEWGFREFDNYQLFTADKTVEQADVWLGVVKKVPLVSPDDLLLTLRRPARKAMKVSVVYEQPIPAPIKQGQLLAQLKISTPGEPDRLFPLVAGADVARLGLVGRVVSAVSYLLWGGGG